MFGRRARWRGQRRVPLGLGTHDRRPITLCWKRHDCGQRPPRPKRWEAKQLLSYHDDHDDDNDVEDEDKDEDKDKSEDISDDDDCSHLLVRVVAMGFSSQHHQPSSPPTIQFSLASWRASEGEVEGDVAGKGDGSSRINSVWVYMNRYKAYSVCVDRSERELGTRPSGRFCSFYETPINNTSELAHPIWISFYR